MIRFLTLLATLWVLGLLLFISQIPYSPTQDDENTDAIVVLTGGTLRLENGLDLIAKGKAKKLFISGVGKGVLVSELIGEARKTTKLPPEIENAVIILGHMASDTKGNARETSEWMEREGFESLRLVTANYHMPRSLLEFSHYMPDVKIIPSPVFPDKFKLEQWWKFQGTATLIVSEYHKYMASQLHYLLVRSGALQNVL